MDFNDIEVEKQLILYGWNNRSREIEDEMGAKKPVKDEVRGSAHQRLLSTMMLIVSVTLLTLSINHVSKEVFLAASAAKAVRSTIVPDMSPSINDTASSIGNSVTTPKHDDAREPTPTPDVVSGALTTDSSSVSKQKTEKTAGSRSSDASHRKHAPSTQANDDDVIHSINNTNITEAEHTSCKICDSNVECTGPKKCIKRRCVENEDELAVCIRNTHQQCGNCVSDDDCHDGYCRSQVCAESIQELHTCKLLFTSYLDHSNDSNDSPTEKINEEGRCDGTVDTCLSGDGGDDSVINEPNESKGSDDVEAKTTMSKEKHEKIDNVDVGSRDCKSHTRARRMRPSSKPSQRRKKQVVDARNDIEYKVSGMALTIEEDEALRIHEQCITACTEKCKDSAIRQEASKTEESNHLETDAHSRTPDGTWTNPPLVEEKRSGDDVVVTKPTPEPTQCRATKRSPSKMPEDDKHNMTYLKEKDGDDANSDIVDTDRCEHQVGGDEDFGEDEDDYEDKFDDGYDPEFNRDYEEEFYDFEYEEDFEPTDDDDDDIDDDEDWDDDDYYEGVDGKYYVDYSEKNPEESLSPDALDSVNMFGMHPKHLGARLQGRNPRPGGKRKASQAK